MTTIQKSARVYTWSELAEDQPMAKIARRRIIGEKMMVSRVELKKGFAVPSHSHDNEQFAVVLDGAIEFGLGDDEAETVTLTAGQVLHIPSNVPHSAKALQDTLILDLFSPPSETTGVDAHG